MLDPGEGIIRGLKIIKEMVERNGDPVHFGTMFCKRSTNKFPDCCGCESEIGCCKFATIISVTYHHTSHYGNDNGRSTRIAMKILRCKTVEDINKFLMIKS